MRIWRFREFGDLVNMKLDDVPNPKPATDEVLIRLKFASLNPADRGLVEGRYPGAGELPLTVGRDGSGIVEKAGVDSGFSEGDSVIILRSEIGITRQGTLAELIAAPARSVAPLPEGWTFEEGAAAPLVYLTAWKALFFQGGLESGDNVLVTGASGGVGIAAIQLAKAAGARVVALSRDADKRDKLKELGADAAVDSGADDMEAQIKDAFDGGGTDVIVENLGGPFIQSGINVSNLHGRIMVIGLLAGQRVEAQLGQLLFKQVRIEGVHVGKFTPPQAQAGWTEIVEMLGGAKARPLIDHIFPMEEVQEAFAHLSGGHLGKILVAVEG
jgi:NADPH2:quinone reductase